MAEGGNSESKQAQTIKIKCSEAPYIQKSWKENSYSSQENNRVNKKLQLDTGIPPPFSKLNSVAILKKSLYDLYVVVVMERKILKP